MTPTNPPPPDKVMSPLALMCEVWSLPNGQSQRALKLITKYREQIRNEALEDAIMIREQFIVANYGQGFDAGLSQGMDEYQAAIRNLKTPNKETKK